MSVICAEGDLCNGKPTFKECAELRLCLRPIMHHNDGNYLKISDYNFTNSFAL